MKRKIIISLICLFLVLMAIDFSFANEGNVSEDYSAQLEGASNYSLSKAKTPAFGLEWTLYPLIAGGYYGETSSALYKNTTNKYNEALIDRLATNGGALDEKYSSAYARSILLLTLMGKDPCNVGGYNLFDKISSMEFVTKQGIMGPTWVLTALNCHDYWNKLNSDTNVKEDSLLDYIINGSSGKTYRTSDGGWGLRLQGSKDGDADVDTTAMILQALAPYYHNSDYAKVTTAIDEGLSALINAQDKNTGEFKENKNCEYSAESISQVIIALSSLGIDCETDSRFQVNGKTPISVLNTYYSSALGGFKHSKSATNVNAMANEQALNALVAYSQFKKSGKSIYDLRGRMVNQYKVPATTSVVVSLYGYDDILAKWNSVTVGNYQVSYKVEYKKTTATSYSLLGCSSLISAKKNNLSDGASYIFRVTPYISLDGVNYYGKPKTSSYIYTLKAVNRPTLSKYSKSYVKVKWNNIAGETGYQIYRSQYKTKGFALVKTASYKYSSAKIKTTRNKNYYYKVRAYKTVSGKKIYGPWSSIRLYKLR